MWQDSFIRPLSITHMDTSQLICFINQFSVFCMCLTMVLSGLMRFPCKNNIIYCHAIEMTKEKLLL